jgi:ABC-type nitrate/sulfonate/bicarbonate transport system permease component
LLAVVDFLFADRRDRLSLRTYLLVVLGFMLAVVLGFMLATAIGEAVFGP